MIFSRASDKRRSNVCLGRVVLALYARNKNPRATKLEYHSTLHLTLPDKEGSLLTRLHAYHSTSLVGVALLKGRVQIV